MRLNSLPILIIIAVLCFFAGYTIGQKRITVTYTDTPEDSESSEPESTQTPVQVTPPPQDQPESEPTSEAVAATPVPSVDMAARAEQQWITFTDQQGRELVAEVIETKTDALRIRRQADGQVFDLPIRLLSESDQAFAAYLQKQSPPPMKEEDLNAIFEELFK